MFRSRTILGLFLWVCLVGGFCFADLTYRNPVVDSGNPADPAVIYHEGVYYMYPTDDTVSYRVYTSTDLVNWERGPRVFEPDRTNLWAPDVWKDPADGRFYLYYTADWNIGVAVAEEPVGPFEDKGLLVEGVIDAHMYHADGRFYLYFSDLENIYVQQMKDPLRMKGRRVSIIQPDQDWETASGRVVEGPWLLEHEGLYYLLYSGSGANSKHYAIGYATAETPLGPFTKYSDNPIISGGEGIYGPGHGSVAADGAGNLWHIYHQKRDDELNYNRFICIDPLWFDDQGVLHGRATRGTVEQGPAFEADGG